MSRSKAKRPPQQQPQPAAHTLGPRFSDPDLVDRIFDYVVQLLPELADRAEEVKEAVRQDFGGQVMVYVRKEGSRRLAQQVLQLFNGRNASEVARELKISRATVYRYLKQPGSK